jgi:hypothetical protein
LTQAVSFADVQSAGNRRRWHHRTALGKWQAIIQTQQELYLPCGVNSLTGLRQSMIIEEMTLVALSRATATARDRASCQKLGQAQAARATRLRELRAAAAMIATIGSTTRCGTAAVGPPTAASVRPARDRGHHRRLAGTLTPDRQGTGLGARPPTERRFAATPSEAR